MVYGNVLPTDVFIGISVKSARLRKSSESYVGVSDPEINS